MKKSSCRKLGLALTLGTTLTVAAPRADAQGLKEHLFGVGHELACEDIRTVEELAALIDRLDKELFKHGKIAVKSPDVWGQNRMTKFRTEYEDEMKAEVRKFRLMLQAYQRRADTAALTSATTIAAAIQPTPARGRSGRGDTTNQNVTNVEIPDTPDIPSGLVANANTLIGTMTPVLGNPGDVARLMLANNSDNAEGFGLEPTIALDQKARYLEHLATLRRNNLGDDTTDLPGYGLYLMRMPISLLPGAESQKGKGASVTIEAKFDPTPDLLPVTFRSVVVLDASYQLKDVLNRALHGSIVLTQTNPSDANAATARNLPPGATITTRSLVPTSSPNPSQATLSPVELLDVYGGANLQALADELKEDEKDWYHHDPSILSWLLTQHSNAYNFYRDGARRGDPLFSVEQVNRLGELAFQRRYGELKAARAEFLGALIERRTGIPVDPKGLSSTWSPGDLEDAADFRDRIDSIDILTYGLMVQMYYLDRQIKFDMEVVSRRKGCACGDPWGLALFEADPSEEARAAFGSYVACKWPIHVFSLDPAVDQQNQLDLFSRRSELQLALAAAVASGEVNFRNATTYARRLETDLATIDLNRTAVGFGAGDTTFGWRFQPRIQTPPTQNNLRRAVGLVWRGGPDIAYDIANRRIEPGPRECVACIVAPNFVPQLRLTSVANWYDLQGHHMNQTMETTDMVRMGAKLQGARAALERICDAHSYPPDQLQMLSDRLDQLQALLPMKAHRVTLPFEGDLTGSEIFSSSNAGLAPKLLTWYGEPQKNGGPSSIFILGTGFSIHELKAVAGGVLVGDIELMSRNVLRIAIPQEARIIETNAKVDGKPRRVIDVHVATPNGVSNHLLVEADPADSAKSADEAVARKSAYAVNDKTKTLGIDYNLIKLNDGSGRFRASNGRPNGTTPSVKINWSAPTGTAPKQLLVTLYGEYKGGRLMIPLASPLVLSAANGVYTMTSDHEKAIANAYVDQLEGYAYFSQDEPLPALKMTSIRVKPVATDRPFDDVVEVEADNDLTIQPRLVPVLQESAVGASQNEQAPPLPPSPGIAPRLEDAKQPDVPSPNTPPSAGRAGEEPPTTLEAIAPSASVRPKSVIPPPITAAARRDAAVKPTAAPAPIKENRESILSRFGVLRR
ncbi:hypothetical protein [Paludisphaera rhizosphaerae]|uniref:hypothetical protein n=1 Tax=Paludisphaera rhizosphaerae TaxID=2711216 RepID=UPI0013EC930A|nr:hypothetical protein [Paludisphaera rhizosphaerae]